MITAGARRLNPGLACGGGPGNGGWMTGNDGWRENLITDERAIGEILARTRRIAVLGIKPETKAGQPAHYVARYLKDSGYDIVPVPVYYPEVEEILGMPVYRDLATIPGEIDLVNVFRRPPDIPRHVDDIITKQPRVVWFQMGIRNDEAAERLARAGIQVVQNRCTMIDHRRFCS
jgi:uncharacterized protein